MIRAVGRFVALTCAVAIGARAALLWRDVNELNATMRLLRNFRWPAAPR